MFDLTPATDEVARLIRGADDDGLSGPTPCPDYPVGALLDHLMALTVAFTAGARKEAMTGDESPPGTSTLEHLNPRWRDLLPQRLAGLAEAWRDPAAWQGMAEVGGVTMPGSVTAVVALDEVVMHGWDLARATGQPYAVDDALAAIVLDFTEQQATGGGLFGPTVPVAGAAPVLQRAVGFAGRDPEWTPNPRPEP